MAARTPRRSFAAPFVVTLAAAPACYTQTAPPPQQPPPQEQPAPIEAPPQQHPPVANPPPPQQPPPQQQQPPQQQASQWTVFKGKDGCMAAIKVQCPPNATCNPPPPFKYACPDGVSLDKPITVASTPDGACFVQREMPKCPPNTMCNPPPPKQVACPKP